MKEIRITIDPEFREKIKIQAAKEHLTIKDLVIKILNESLKD